jgi:hypothetical protein
MLARGAARAVVVKAVMPTRQTSLDRLGLLAWLAVCSAIAPRVARADVIDACASAAVSAQKLQRAGKFQDARTSFLACVRPECPAEVKAVCDGLLSALDTSMPTVIFGARTEDGQDLVDVHVFVDGVTLLTALDGKAVPIDPGPHTLRFEREGSPPVERRVVIREAEKDRLVTLTFVRRVVQPSPPAAPPQSGGETRPTPVLVYVLGGIGLASLAGFIYLDAHGQSEYDACKPPAVCSQSTVNALGVDRALAFGSLGLGVISLAAGAWIWIARPARTNAAISLTVAPSPGGGNLLVTF